jgi:hypothetical protein
MACPLAFLAPERILRPHTTSDRPLQKAQRQLTAGGEGGPDETEGTWSWSCTSTDRACGLGSVSHLRDRALADPSHNIQAPQTLTCDNNTTVVINPGTIKNRSHEGFVVGSTSILVVNYVAVTDATGTTVFFDTAAALTAQGLVTCSGDLGEGVSITVRGFFTPRT